MYILGITRPREARLTIGPATPSAPAAPQQQTKHPSLPAPPPRLLPAQVPSASAGLVPCQPRTRTGWISVSGFPNQIRLVGMIRTRSVMMVLTQFAPVRGRLHFDTILGDPSLAVWLVATTILVLSGLEIRSMAPPMPLKTLPGIM